MRLSNVCLLAAVALTALVSQKNATAQTPVLGGLIEGRNYYNGYGMEDYGGYGFPSDKYLGFGHPFGVYDFTYSGYGNGPYGAGSGSEHEFLSTNRFSHGDAYYDGYGAVGYSGASRPQRYNPYGYGVPRSHRFNWSSNSSIYP